MLKQRFEIHPAATLFPLMTDEEFEGLKKDIAENGQREDIVVWQGKIIDGRNRLKACEELQRQPDIAELDEDEDPWKYVISHNLHRRHLTTSQRGMVAAKLAKLREGRPSKETPSNDGVSTAQAAKTLNVGTATVERAKQVQEHGSESVKQAVEQGEIPVSVAAKLVKEVPDKKEQTRIVKEGPKAIKQAASKPPATPLVLKTPNKCVQAFRDSKERLQTLRFIFDLLEPHEVEVIRGWLNTKD